MGLINYQVDSESRPAPIAPPATSHFMVLADTPFGLQPTNPFPPSFMTAEKKPNIKTEVKDKEQAIATNKDEDKDETKEADGNGPPKTEQETAANEMETDAPEPEKPGTSSAPKSISEAGLKTDQYSKQLAAMKAKGAAPGRDWTQQETLLLLEALEMYKDDWNQVADHVGTRTQDECILFFIQLPIQDPYLEETDGAEAVQSGNPVMSTIAFLASVVDPRIASAAAKAALEEFGKMKDEIPPLLVDAHTKNIEAHSKANEGAIDASVGLAKSGIVVESTEDEFKGESKTGEPQKMDTNQSTSPKPTGTAGKQSGSNEEGEANTVAVECRQAISETVQTAAATALAAAAVKAKHLANLEERRMKTLVANLVETQMKKLELKLKHFEELEAIMDREREALEYQRQQLILERQSFHLDQLRYLEQRAKHDAQSRLVSNGQIPANLPPGFEVSGPPQPKHRFSRKPASNHCNCAGSCSSSHGRFFAASTNSSCFPCPTTHQQMPAAQVTAPPQAHHQPHPGQHGGIGAPQQQQPGMPPLPVSNASQTGLWTSTGVLWTRLPTSPSPVLSSTRQYYGQPPPAGGPPTSRPPQYQYAPGPPQRAGPYQQQYEYQGYAGQAAPPHHRPAPAQVMDLLHQVVSTLLDLTVHLKDMLHNPSMDIQPTGQPPMQMQGQMQQPMQQAPPTSSGQLDNADATTPPMHQDANKE
uniref:SANT domain-containing protein n=1 Tax=Ditylenchus dipsaci TaxID=166011 RepID=A0A915DJ91_9BILA